MQETIRLDKYLSQLGLVSRRSVGKIVASGALLLDGQPIYKSDLKIRYGQMLTYGGQDILVQQYVYVILNKPAGYVCSDIDEGGHMSYQHLLTDCPYGSMLHVAGRLDQDTEGLVLCSNDGIFTHNIISPKKHLEKEYYVRTRDEIHDQAIDHLIQGVILDDGYQTLPARVIKDGSHSLRLIIVEGKYHQVKRMLEAVGNEVIYLRRDRIGDWTTQGIDIGKWAYLQK